MRILYDGEIYRLQKTGGISRYFNNLLDGLPKDVNPFLTVRYPFDKHFSKNTKLKVYCYNRDYFRIKRFVLLTEQAFYRTSIPLIRPHLIHLTYYSTLYKGSINQFSKPVVITVFDMIHEIFSEQMDPDGTFAGIKKRAILSADAIICISENTKKDLLDRYSLTEDRISVIHLASNLNKSISYGNEPTPEEPYFLYVGDRLAPYKNFQLLLSAFKRISYIKKNVTLCIVGPPFNENERKFIEQNNIADKIKHYGIVKDNHLAKLYRYSTAFIYPSLYEGFGIPLLEAMSCGAPVIASNSSSIPEVVGDAGILFNPNSVNDLVDMMVILLKENNEREKLILKGYERIKQFSVEKTVDRTVKVYRSLL